jgi:3-phenylpropionate/cinnamic acid dioxygenase small subunit
LLSFFLSFFYFILLKKEKEKEKEETLSNEVIILFVINRKRLKEKVIKLRVQMTYGASISIPQSIGR